VEKKLIQSWLPAIGLILDVVGVLIILREWWLAHKQAKDEIVQSLRSNDLISILNEKTHDRAYAISKAIEELTETSSEIATIAKLRPLLVKIGALFICCGFLVQLVAAWPRGKQDIGFNQTNHEFPYCKAKIRP
jgi:hypothetical protein